MASSSRQHTRKTKAAPASPGLSSELLETLMEANTQAAQVWLDGWLKLVSETTNFTVKRWGLDAEFLKRLGTCTTPVEVMELQTEFMQRAMKEYIEEATKLGDMETDAAVSGIEALDRGVQKATKAKLPKVD